MEGAAPEQTAPSLLEAYARWRAREDAEEQRPSAGAIDPDEREARAMRKSVRVLRHTLHAGVELNPAGAVAYGDYKRRGGRLDFEHWVVRIFQTAGESDA